MLQQETFTQDTSQEAQDKRFSTRYRVQLPILFSGDLVHGKGLVFNLSRSGCGLKTSKNITPGIYVHLLLRLPQERIPLKVELAAVRWANHRTCGIEFIRMSGQQQRRLGEYINFLGMTPAVR
jgi:c-di-GMP-binding flagellar brake protein YcgR